MRKVRPRSAGFGYVRAYTKRFQASKTFQVRKMRRSKYGGYTGLKDNINIIKLQIEKQLPLHIWKYAEGVFTGTFFIISYYNLL